jgi:hypothetical protein
MTIGFFSVLLAAKPMSSVSPINNALCLGNSNVSLDTIDAVVKDLFNTYVSEYRTVVADTIQNLEKAPDYYSDLQKSGLPGKYFRNGYVLIPEQLIHDRSGEERYYIHLDYEIANLKNDSPITTLALTLHKMVCEYGFDSNSVAIRLEKGCFYSHPDYWHLDGVKLGHSIAVCWGSKTNWSTRVLDEKSNAIFAGEKVYRHEEETDKKIEAVAKAAQFGHFYNARKVFHRGPRIEDLGDEKLGVNDYRLFIRFIKK